ncbi:phosphate ABC transporter permease subunit PstC [Sphingomicrobium astaxanthinifaciens]|uniref:phosphate ABC transporter permease subunit PstC n=1 Tax=Sphingomicrobium astaxanthinifaciens TaxID=1227949 RepID=UPI001FCACD7A|nr:phosphate ABC transporter permease subunit PstC [Sphingomicrobium astaxanthinifaciens]MCJ7421561.1 phosphate ABC transporter permease subunit PstC [Sphingomicrobium astaxanthinifaciens]
MSLFVAAMIILVLAAAAAFTTRTRVSGLRRGGERLHSLPGYHGIYVFLWSAVPALLLLAIWAIVQGGLVEQAVLASPAGQALPDFDLQRDAILSEARAIAGGYQSSGFYPQSEALAPVHAAARAHYGWMGAGVAFTAFLVGLLFAMRRTGAAFRARTGVERWMMVVLVGASMIAIFTTLGIVLSLMFETLLFFQKVNPVEFLFGTQWSPQTAIRADQAGSSGAFGSVPLFWGTIFIGAIIAMIVAIPLGLMSAIFLTQYAHARVRAWLKPILEILAGVPTVVYGYFAALTVAPAIRDLGVTLGIPASSESALAAGLVMGIMIIPFVSSMADDSIAAVPQAMNDGSLALGATRSETIKKVIFPAALPGIVGGILLAVSRAIGETMIVVMAAGLAANLTANPFASVTTVTVQIVQLLTGDQEFDSAKTLAAFALGLVLFFITLLLNLYALRVVRKYREAYE